MFNRYLGLFVVSGLLVFWLGAGAFILRFMRGAGRGV